MPKILHSLLPKSLHFWLPFTSKANRHSAGADAVFLHVADPYESKLSTAHRHTKKAQPFGCALLCFRDSVGIRTQDPQLRRLLLYPTELPNRSVFVPIFSESGCKGNTFFWICKFSYFSFLESLFPAISIPVTRLKPMMAKRMARPICRSIWDA